MLVVLVVFLVLFHGRVRLFRCWQLKLPSEHILAGFICTGRAGKWSQIYVSGSGKRQTRSLLCYNVRVYKGVDLICSIDRQICACTLRGTIFPHPHAAFTVCLCGVSFLLLLLLWPVQQVRECIFTNAIKLQLPKADAFTINFHWWLVAVIAHLKTTFTFTLKIDHLKCKFLHRLDDFLVIDFCCSDQISNVHFNILYSAKKCVCLENGSTQMDKIDLLGQICGSFSHLWAHTLVWINYGVKRAQNWHFIDQQNIVNMPFLWAKF